MHILTKLRLAGLDGADNVGSYQLDRAGSSKDDQPYIRCRGYMNAARATGQSLRQPREGLSMKTMTIRPKCVARHQRGLSSLLR